MYAPFFGLQQAPFSIAPDPRYLFMSERHREALAHLLYGVGGEGGFVLLSGEIGAGKTTLCRCFLEQVPATCQVAYIFNPRLTVDELLQTVCQEFGVAVPAPVPGGLPTAKACIDALNAHLLAVHAQGRRCVLVIDEAQNLSPEVLEQLRLLTNLETTERKLLQIMLIGQPELRDMLARPGLEQLAQRVMARYHLGALGPAETSAYLAHRLAVAGRAGASPFDAAALKRIHQISGGVPRRINLLADRALLGAYAQGQPQVGRRIVAQAAREVFDAGRQGKAGPVRRRLGLAAAAVLVLAGVGAVAWRGGAASAGSGRAGSGAAAGGPAAAVSAAAASVARSAAGASAPAGSATVAGAGGAVKGAALSAPAPMPLASTMPAAAAPDEVARRLAGWTADDAPGWRALAALWGVPAGRLADGLSATEVCQALPPLGLRCHRGSGATLAGLRQLDRPVLLPLQAGEGPPRSARLVALAADRVVLAQGQQTLTLSLADFSQRWRGDFSTLWRPPEGYQDVLLPGARGTAVEALARALATASPPAAGDAVAPAPDGGQRLDAALAARLAAFQVAHSLRPDGLAGPTTFMQLNRATGVAEPRLAATASER